jgi:hypothetical protein
LCKFRNPSQSQCQSTSTIVHGTKTEIGNDDKANATSDQSKESRAGRKGNQAPEVQKGTRLDKSNIEFVNH